MLAAQTFARRNGHFNKKRPSTFGEVAAGLVDWSEGKMPGWSSPPTVRDSSLFLQVAVLGRVLTKATGIKRRISGGP